MNSRELDCGASGITPADPSDLADTLAFSCGSKAASASATDEIMAEILAHNRTRDALVRVDRTDLMVTPTTRQLSEIVTCIAYNYIFVER